jgi:undecaprenyldiphospho-muramoylpentapeptide beta-N-acetylglucosaminyltransferase
VYPALAILESLVAEYPDLEVLWVGGDGNMEAELVAKAGVPFESIPAAGVHGVGWRRLPGNLLAQLRGVGAARKILNRFQPDVLLFTGGYIAGPMAVAGFRIPTVLFVPDIEPGLALKFLARFANRIAVTAEDSYPYFPNREKLQVTGYPLRPAISAWDKKEAYAVFGFTPEIPTMLVTGGSLGSLSINKSLVAALSELLPEMQIIHITGTFTWPQFENVGSEIGAELAENYRGYPYLHAEMGAAFTIADLVLSRAGASSIGEYPHFGIPAILAPYPYAWRYQMVNAKYLVRNNAAVILEDAEMPQKLLPLVRDLMRDHGRRHEMKTAMQSLARPEAANAIAALTIELAAQTERARK